MNLSVTKPTILKSIVNIGILKKVTISIALICIAWFLKKKIKELVRRKFREKEIIFALDKVSSVFILFIVLLALLSIWEVKGGIEALVTSIGVSSLVIGLAIKDTLANTLAGIIIFLDKPFKIGDWIKVNGKWEGEVVDIGFRFTKLKKDGNTYIYIPNNMLLTKSLEVRKSKQG